MMEVCMHIAVGMVVIIVLWGIVTVGSIWAECSEDAQTAEMPTHDDVWNKVLKSDYKI
jgi:hypothetical protein